MRRSLAFLCILLLAATMSRAITSAEIDTMLAATQAQAGVQPAGGATDAEFFRRLSLDVRGVVPSLEETVEFLEDKSKDKRARQIEKFLASQERGEHWASYWDKVLIGTLQQPQNATAQMVLKQPFKDWAARQFNDNVPYSTFMRDIVDAHGLTSEVPQALPLARWQNASESMAGTMSRAFLGAQIQCAQCHDHKENAQLTQKKFWEFAAFFGNTRAVLIRDDSKGNRRVDLDVRDTGMRWQMPVPDTKPQMTVAPRYLDGTPAAQNVVDEDGKPVTKRGQAQAARQLMQVRQEVKNMNGDGAAIADAMQKARETLPYIHDTRREQLANLILKQDSEQFAANMVNRTWARFFGRGLLEPVDAWDSGSPSDHPELLKQLAIHFRGTGYDVRDLERLLLNTAAYQRAGKPSPTSSEYPELFGHAAVRPLTPEQLLTSLIQVTDADGMIQSAGRDRGREQYGKLQQTYAAQFVHTFGNDEMEWTNTFESSIPRALFLLNDSGINNVIRNSGEHSMLTRIANTTKKPEEQAQYLYLAALSRMPAKEESTALAREITSAQKKGENEWRALMEDAFWALLNSTEFITNH